MRLYQGVDIVDVAKLRAVMARHSRFADEVFTDRERAYCRGRRDPMPHFAARFAAKEACLKALGRGLSTLGIDGILQEIEVISRPSGKPVLELSGSASLLSRRKKIIEATVSLSHTAHNAVATVIFLAEGSLEER